jgi:hypothetical protein
MDRYVGMGILLFVAAICCFINCAFPTPHGPYRPKQKI